MAGKRETKHQLTPAQKRKVRQALLDIEKTNRELQLKLKRVRNQLERGTFHPFVP
jgi:hypothetical protein